MRSVCIIPSSSSRIDEGEHAQVSQSAPGGYLTIDRALGDYGYSREELPDRRKPRMT